MRRIILTFLSLPIICFAQNNFPTSGNAKMQNANLLLETAQWHPGLLTFKDTHYNPDQEYTFQLESNGLKIRQDNTVRYLFKSGGGLHINDGDVVLNSNPYSSFKVVRPNGAQMSMAVTTDSHQGLLASTGEIKFLTDLENGDSSAKMLLNRSGNLGIGTTNPAFRLQINDPVGGAAIGIKRAGKLWRFDMAFNGNKLFLGHSDVPSMMSFDNMGRVGIGTVSPDSKLAVNGNIRAKEVKVEATNWPDFVFADDYDLPPLEELQKHIDEKGHLPNIPSAKEVEANGIVLGEMNKLLLEKIEELTLYILTQQKELDNKEIRIGFLEKENVTQERKLNQITILENRMEKMEKILVELHKN